LYKKKEEYEGKKQEKIEKQLNEITFQPKTNKSKQYKVTKDVIERNNDFLHRK
jgi:hypothetical protein